MQVKMFSDNESLCVDVFCLAMKYLSNDQENIPIIIVSFLQPGGLTVQSTQTDLLRVRWLKQRSPPSPCVSCQEILERSFVIYFQFIVRPNDHDLTFTN